LNKESGTKPSQPFSQPRLHALPGGPPADRVNHEGQVTKRRDLSQESIVRLTPPPSGTSPIKLAHSALRCCRLLGPRTGPSAAPSIDCAQGYNVTLSHLEAPLARKPLRQRYSLLTPRGSRRKLTNVMLL